MLLEPSVSQVIAITRFVHYIKLNLQSGALSGVDSRNKIKTSQGCGIVPPFTDLHQMFFRPINGKTPFDLTSLQVQLQAFVVTTSAVWGSLCVEC